jgi:GT2 family glycosyltransferase
MSGVSIVIPSWNGRELLEEFLPSVLRAAERHASASREPIEVVVVDDGGTDDTVSWCDAEAARSDVPLHVVRLEANQGFGEACNRGVAAARHPLVWLLNNDVAVEPDAIAPLVGRFGEPPNPRLFAVHCRVLDFASGRQVGTGKMGGFARGFLRVHRSYVTREPPAGPLHSMFASGGSAMVNRAIFLELGGFDPLFAPFYFEDVELCYRAWKRGFDVGYEPRSVVTHRFSSTIGPLAGRQVPRIGQRNRLIFHWMHLHDGPWLASHVAWVVLLALAAPLTFKPAFMRALVDALGRLPRIRARRQAERARAVRTDRQVIGIFRELGARPDIRAYDDPRELGEERGE